ncbi:MAG TPA: dTDP-glucose 4,6-dehydratase [Candidatus Binatus sp.]|nr:dTDP-glucose 4,6-dehydratase [Candidatus Binatus sp.]
MERLIVTGGLGFIGSNFIHHILDNRSDLTVVNVDYQGPSSNLSNVKDLRQNKRYRQLKGNLTDPKIARWIVKNADLVVHFAAETHVDRSIANPKPFLESNILGTYALLEAARKSKIRRLIHISTDEVYGSAYIGESFVENSGLDPSSPYSGTKAASDQLVTAWTRTYKVPAVIMRCTNNYGPYQHPEKLIPKTIIRGLSDLEIPLYGGGTQIRDWIYVLDFSDAIMKALEKGDVGETFNVSTGNELTNKEIVGRILKLIGKPLSLMKTTEDRPGHDTRYSLSSEKARKVLDWRPTHEFDDALRLTVDWYRNHGSWWKPLATRKTLSKTPWKEKW